MRSHVDHAPGPSAPVVHRSLRSPSGPRPRNLLELQRTAGNRAVAELLRRPAPHPKATGFTTPPTVQRCGDRAASGQCSCCGDEKADGASDASLQRSTGAVPTQATSQGGERSTVQRRVDGDVRAMSITPEWTRALTDPELASQLMLLRQHVGGLPGADPQREGAATNLRLLEAESERRTAAQAMAGLRLGSYVPRPAGLPDGGFAVTELPDIPPEALAQLPEGQLTTVATASLYGLAPMASLGASAGAGANVSGVGPAAARGTEVVGTAGGAGTLASGLNMRLWGFPGSAQGQYTVGVVVRPRAHALDWGHTSLTLRRGGGAPLEVIGFNPDMRTPQGLLDLIRHHKEVELGSRAVRGRFTSDASMFTVNESIHVEYPITEAEAAKFAMTKPGRAPTLDYVARPAVYRPPPGACQASNCGLWAIGEVERQTAGTVGRVGDPAGITSMGRGGPPVPNRGSQPAIVDMAQGGLNDPATIRPLRPGGAPPMVSAMPRVVRVLRVGGKVMLVVGVVAGIAEVATAKPEERNRTAAGVAGGFAGGFLLGAGAGLICGPGAPLCSFALGLTLGTIGALGGRAAAEYAYDQANEPASGATGATGGATASGPGSPQALPESTQWELLFVAPPPPVETLFLDVTRQTPLIRPATSLDLAFAGLPTAANP